MKIYEEERLYYPCSENKGADQLRGYREADLRLCFRLCKLLVFPWGGSSVGILTFINRINWLGDLYLKFHLILAISVLMSC